MAPPKTYRDYDSFDAYVDNILLKRSSKEGMFAVWNQECADTEALIALLRLYRDQLKKEGASEELLKRVGRYSGLIYGVRTAGTHETMKQMLKAASDFNRFLQSDAGNGVNHFSRILRLASQRGNDLAQVGSGFRALSKGLELGLELDPDKLYTGPGCERNKVSGLLPEEEIVREKNADKKAAPGSWVKRPENRKYYEMHQNYAPGKEIDKLSIPELEALDQNEAQLPEVQTAGVENNAMSRPAKDWIVQFQTTHDVYEARRDPQGNKIPRTDWLLRLLAVRSLVGAEPGDKSFYRKSISFQAVKQRAEELAREPEVKSFLDNLKRKPSAYASTMENARKGTGSGLDRMVKLYVAANGLAPQGKLMKRYLPSAEQRVDCQKYVLKNKAEKREDKLDCVSQIIASRLAVSARRGGLTGMDDRMKNAPDSEAFAQCRKLTRDALEKLAPAELGSLLTVAQAGHGGKMLERFTALTRIDAQNWQGKVREQQGPRIE